MDMYLGMLNDNEKARNAAVIVKLNMAAVALRNPDIITTLIVTLNTPYNYDHVRFFILRVPTPDHGNTRTDDVINMLGTDHYL